MKSALKKLSNFWYYYKYYILVLIIVAVALFAVIKSCSEKNDYDVGMIFMNHGYGTNYNRTETLDAIAQTFGQFAPDRNGDGKTDVQIVTIDYGNTVQQSNSANSARSANLAAGKNVLFLLDEQNYNELKAGGFLADLSGLGQSKYLDSDSFDVNASGLFSSIEDFIMDGQEFHLCLRVLDEKRAEKDSEYAQQYEAAKTLMANIINRYENE